MQITARRSRLAPDLFLAIALCATATFSACGGKGNAAPAVEPPEIPLEQQTEQKLDPLTKEDVELYLKVMRAAAERVKIPTPGDTAALEGARKILATGASGRVPTSDDVKTLERANLVAIYMDQILAADMKLDGRTYRGIAEAIEAVIPNPALGAASSDGDASGQDHVPTLIEKRLGDVNATNTKFIAPYHDEIQKLVATVRNPTNLPK